MKQKGRMAVYGVVLALVIFVTGTLIGILNPVATSADLGDDFNTIYDICLITNSYLTPQGDDGSTVDWDGFNCCVGKAIFYQDC